MGIPCSLVIMSHTENWHLNNYFKRARWKKRNMTFEFDLQISVKFFLLNFVCIYFNSFFCEAWFDVKLSLIDRAMPTMQYFFKLW